MKNIKENICYLSIMAIIMYAYGYFLTGTHEVAILSVVFMFAMIIVLKGLICFIDLSELVITLTCKRIKREIRKYKRKTSNRFKLD